MIIDIIRYSSQDDSTLGILLLDGKFECYTLEDEHRDQKIMHKTRIPDGIYKIGIRDQGGFHNRYKKMFPDIHAGMIEVKDVPNFKYILFHIGNTEADTSGCILLGQNAYSNTDNIGFIGNSKKAYIEFYKKVIRSIKNENVFLNIKTIG